MSKKEKYKVFLITWEGTTDISEKEKKIALVTSLRHTRQVDKIMQALYNSKYLSIEEQLGMAKYNKPSQQIYPVIQNVKEEECSSMIKRHVFLTCGDNPFLLGRVVTNFQVKYDKNGKASYKWDEKEMTNFPKLPKYKRI